MFYPDIFVITSRKNYIPILKYKTKTKIKIKIKNS